MSEDNMPTENFPLNPGDGNNSNARSRKFLWYAVCVASLFQMSSGAAAVWTSPVLPKLKDANSTDNPLRRRITSYEEGLIASIHTIGALTGPLIFRTADLLGRKWFFITVSITEFCSFVVLALAEHIYMIYLGRMIQGLCIACAWVLPIYISELSENHNRGKLVTVNNVFLCLGNVYGYTLGSFLQFKSFTLICSIPLVISVSLFIFSVPESPLYLVMNGKEHRAKQALKKFRNLNDDGAEKVVFEIKKMIDEMPTAESMLVLLKNRSFRRSLIISFGVFTFIEFTGIIAILENLHSILSSTDIPFPQNSTTIIVSIIQTFSVLLGTILIEKLGRKLLQLSSALVVTISLFLIGIYFQLKAFNFDTHDISWLPMAAGTFYIVAYGAGLGSVCSVLMGEIFPSEFRVRGSILSVITTEVAAFIVLFCFPLVRDSFGLAWCFWIFGISTLLYMIFTHIYIIETKNKSFLEIQSMLAKKINYGKPNYS